MCEARGVGYSLIGSRDELIERVSDPAPGLNVIEVRIERHLERQARHDLFAAAIDAVADAGEMDARYERR